MNERPYWWRPDDLPSRRGAPHGAGYGAYGSGHGSYGDYGGREERRGWAEQAGDEVKSWLGNERAERRRDWDKARARERRDEREGFRGVGPRTRVEEDDWLRDAICRRIADDPSLDASDIVVRVIDGEVILDGVVDRDRDAARAHEIARHTPGVVYVRDRLETHRSREDRVRRATIGMGYDEGPPHRRRMT
jgi:osmotically-inducible protein OsmY